MVKGGKKKMKVILAMVMSVDGKTTKWSNPKIYEWTSKEDQNHFSSLIESSRVIIIGRKTFVAAKSIIKLSPNNLRIILTKAPKEYESISIDGQLEFTDDSPKEILKKLKTRGYTQALLAGGEHVNALFFKEHLINEVWLTIEPHIFGFGNQLVAEEKLDTQMQLKSIRRLNKNGTILLKYLVI